MRALILAAGRGRRMKGLTDERPKALLPVNGRPLIEWSLESLRIGGINEVGLVTGYKADLLQAIDVNISFHNDAWETTNMVASAFCADSWLAQGDTIICYSDILFTANAITALKNSSGDIVVSNNLNWQKVWQKRFADPLLDAETFKRDGRGILTEIGNKPKSLDEIQGQFMGLLKVTRRGWDSFRRHYQALPSEKAENIDMTSTLNTLIHHGEKINTVDVSEDWFEFDSEEDLNAYV